MKIESRAETNYPHIEDNGQLVYTESALAERLREAYVRGAEEQRKEDKMSVSVAAMMIYEFFFSDQKEIPKEKFVNAFTDAVL